MPAQAGTQLAIKRSWVPAFAGMTERVVRFTAAFDCERKVEGLSPSRLHASMLERVGYWVFGMKPDHSRRLCVSAQATSVQWHQKTQRFWPAKLTLANSTKGGALEPEGQTARSNALRG